jgi:uncharacterized protein YjiS (DUF1127 family)
MARPNASIGSLGRVLTWLKNALAEHRRRAKIINELSQCSDRELADMGISRYDFAAIARGTYQR